jgi:hypothetical protein
VTCLLVLGNDLAAYLFNHAASPPSSSAIYFHASNDWSAGLNSLT